MRALAAVATVLSLAGASHAEPVVGTTMSYGDSLGGEADGRFGANIYMYGRLGGGWTVGGELSGSLEGYTGGYGCGTLQSNPGDVVPAVAVTCLQPGIATHVLLGTQAAPSPSSQLRLELGVGATAVYLVPGQGGDTQRDTFGSGLIRAMYLTHLGTGFAGDWWAGIAFEERAIGVEHTRLVRSFGIVLEGRSD